MREATLTTEEVQSLISKDGLLTNMLISGDTQGITQLITSVSTILDNQADQGKLDQDSSKGGDGEPSFEDNEAKEVRMKVCKDLPYSSSLCDAKALISFSTETVFDFVIFKCYEPFLIISQMNLALKSIILLLLETSFRSSNESYAH